MLGAAMATTAPQAVRAARLAPVRRRGSGAALKAIDYERVDLLPLSQLLVGPLRYGGTTVPGMRIDGERLVGSRTIMRRLDELAPEPPLLPPPGDPRYARVLEAERWGDEVFQSVPRRLIDAAFLRDPRAMESYAGDAKLPLPRALLRPALPLTARLMAIRNKATRRDRARRPRGAAAPARADRRLDRRGPARRRAAQRRRPADRQHDPPADDHRRRAPADRGAPGGGLMRYFPPMAGEVPARHAPARVAGPAATAASAA